MTNDKRFTLRVNAQLLDKIRESAAVERRSTSKEIEQAMAHYLAFKNNGRTGRSTA